MSREKQIEEMARKNCHIEYHMKNYKTCKECYETNYRACRVYEVCKNLYNAGYRKQSDLTPCDVCRFNPPSSADGKPCLVCPAQANEKGGE